MLEGSLPNREKQFNGSIHLSRFCFIGGIIYVFRDKFETTIKSMKENLVKIRNVTNRFLYKNIVKPVLFRIDPEKVHDATVSLGKLLGMSFITRSITSMLFSYSNKKLEQDILGIWFKNPIGLAAGFDKNADIGNILPSIGFGHVEVGSITGEPCEGNPKPRLWRLKKSEGLVVYYGLKSAGCEKIARKLRGKKFNIPIGVSVAKTNCKETVNKEAGIRDYVKAFSTLKDIGDYTTINISCPNAFGGQPFTKAEDLDDLLTKIEEIPFNKPTFLKLMPDLSTKELDDIISVCDNHRIDGFICANLTKDRTNVEIKKHLKDVDVKTVGGISGRPIKNLSTKLIKYIYQKTKGKYIIIGCGGVFSAEDAYEKIKAGASLIQLITGMIFEGPQLISEINQGLVVLLEKDGYKNISQAIGKA